MEIIIKSKKFGDKTVLIDEEDYDKIKNYKWGVYKYGNDFYIKRFKAGSVLALHRVVMENPYGVQIDHINHDTLDNRKCNLRFCTQSQNNQNKKKTNRATSSKYKGVAWSKKDKRFRAKITVNKKDIYLGNFRTEEDAAKAYNDAAAKYFGNFAFLNIIKT
jgi:hypothetical protein